jgi:hypothetical protein
MRKIAMKNTKWKCLGKILKYFEPHSLEKMV